MLPSDRMVCLTHKTPDNLARYGKPEIFNTDQTTQFISDAFTSMLHGHGIAVSMDSRGCWRDNVFVERLWGSIKRSNTKRFICTPIRASARRKPASRATSSSTTVGVRIPRSATAPRTRHTSPGNLKERSLNEIRVTRRRPVRGFPPPQEIHLPIAEICLNYPSNLYQGMRRRVRLAIR